MKLYKLLLILLFTATGCYSHSIDKGMLNTGGAVIKSMDGEFTIRPFETFNSPFNIDCVPHATPQLASITGVWTMQSIADDINGKRYNSIPFFLDRGAKKVIVEVEGREPLYGLLILCRAWRQAEGINSEFHKIEIPITILENAYNGNVDAAYATYPGVSDRSRFVWYSWLLFLSQAPFENGAAFTPSNL